MCSSASAVITTGPFVCRLGFQSLILHPGGVSSRPAWRSVQAQLGHETKGRRRERNTSWRMNDQKKPARTPTCQMPAEIQETEFPGRPGNPKEKKIIHFASGETLEVQDSEEEEEAEESSPKRSPFEEPAKRTRFSFKKMAVLIGRVSLQTCDFLGKRFAAALGLNVAKYQYAVDQYHHHHKAPGSRAAEGPAESVQLSGRPAGSRYGATGNPSGTAAPPLEKHEHSAEGRHNRGYREDDNNSK